MTHKPKRRDRREASADEIEITPAMLAAGVDERIRRDLMGHSLKRQRYGAGATLEMASEIIQRVAL